MALLDPLFRGCSSIDNWPRSISLERRLRLSIGKIVKVATKCSVIKGRLLCVERDFIIVRRKRKRFLIRMDAICWIRALRRRPLRRLRRRRCIKWI